MLFAISLAFLASGATAGSDVYDWLSLKDEYSMSIKPIFDSKCVACHSCFNGPCQLKLSSFWGAHRGASKIGIYDFARATAIKPTRMFEDARTTNDWRKKGFYSVVDANTNNKPILLTMIEDLGGIEDGLQTMYESEKSRVCINSASKKNILNYKEKNKSGRMPYGLPKLSTKEISAIKKWIRGGASGPDLQEVENQVLNHPKIKHLVKKWENFLNQEDLKTQLSARYFYEHLFLAHIAFDKKSGIYFRLVRSKSKIGIIQPIGTALPYDDPNRKFYYRFMPELETLTYKNHIPFYLDNKKLAKWKKEFVLSTWKEKLTKLPAYGRSGANPFKVFRLIPVQARYNFLLDEAGYFVMSFIKGPVCRGPTALNVINDHFWVMFVDPKEDPSVNDPTLYSFIEGKMNFPAAAKGDIMPISEYRQRYWQTVKFKFDRIKSKGKATSTKMIWNGGKNKNTNSLLTVFRHFDSAHVMRGLQGRTPKTLWLLDYHVFETIYYNLTAGYNVFGPGQHQLNSRVFMDLSRIAAEDYFISMLPQKYRTPLRLNWNKPAPKSKKNTKICNICRCRIRGCRIC